MIIALNNKSNLEKEDFEKYLEELKTVETTETLILCPTFLNNCFIFLFISSFVSLWYSLLSLCPTMAYSTWYDFNWEADISPV